MKQRVIEFVVKNFWVISIVILILFICAYLDYTKPEWAFKKDEVKEVDENEVHKNSLLLYPDVSDYNGDYIIRMPDTRSKERFDS